MTATPLDRLRKAGDIPGIAAALDVDLKHFHRALRLARKASAYHVFGIPKRRGGTRQISAPTVALRGVQAALHRVLTEIARPRGCVHGFRAERSIVTNARVHARARWVLRVDLRDFFPSINFGRVQGALMGRPYQLGFRTASILANIACMESGERPTDMDEARKSYSYLPQGAPSSPVLSNMICARLDGELTRLAKTLGCKYTRYADDLVFSTRARRFPHHLAELTLGTTRGPAAIGETLQRVIESNGFKVNDEKTRLRRQDAQQMVTGLVVNSGVNLPRRFVRNTRGALHAIEKFGFAEADRKYRSHARLHPRRGTLTDYLRGRLAYYQMVLGVNGHAYRRLAMALADVMPDTFQPPALVGGSAGRQPHNPTEESTWQELKRRYGRSACWLAMHGRDESHGTAFRIGSRTFVTSAHNERDHLEIHTPGGSAHRVVGFRAHPRFDSITGQFDAAIIHVEEVPADMGQPFLVVDEASSTLGSVAALGFPVVPKRHPSPVPVLRTGRVEGRASTLDGESESMQVSFEVTPGMSGGPVFNALGEVVGICTEQTQAESVARDIPVIASHAFPSSLLGEISP